MKKQKKFDCVVMKWEIQKKMAEEFSDISEVDAHKIQHERISRNPRLGPFLRKLHSIQKRQEAEPVDA